MQLNRRKLHPSGISAPFSAKEIDIFRGELCGTATLLDVPAGDEMHGGFREIH
jgi:hypothetical protein